MASPVETRPHTSHVPAPAHRALDHLTAILLDVQRLRRVAADADPGDLGERLHRLELKVRGAARAVSSQPAAPASSRRRPVARRGNGDGPRAAGGGPVVGRRGSGPGRRAPWHARCAGVAGCAGARRGRNR
jgi:hypothetical protein